MALSSSTACTNGNKFAILPNIPPTSSKSNHTPESQADKFVSNAPQIPPTCFTLKILPHKSPSAIWKIAKGIMAKMAYTIFIVTGSPRKIATT